MVDPVVYCSGSIWHLFPPHDRPLFAGIIVTGEFALIRLWRRVLLRALVRTSICSRFHPSCGILRAPYVAI